MPIDLLDRHYRTLAPCPPDVARLLAEEPASQPARDVLARFRLERTYLRCDCGRILHVVERGRPFLRRNPLQPVAATRECGLCESAARSDRDAEGASAPAPPIDLILRALPARQAPPARPPAPAPGRPTAETRATRRDVGILMRILEEARLTELAHTIGCAELWGRVRAVLQRVRLRERNGVVSSHSLADFCWTPGGLYRGGLQGLNRRLAAQWPLATYRPEGWVLAIVDRRPVAEDGRCIVRVHPLGLAARTAIAARGGTVYPPMTLTVPEHSVARVGATGPYVALAAGSVNLRGPAEFAKPDFHRLALYAVTAETFPVPVESEYERGLALELLRRRLPFRKPIVPDDEGLRPDFVLHAHHILVEVQGLDGDYRERKAEVHRRLLASPAYRGFRLLTFRANDGQTLAEFARELPPR